MQWLINEFNSFKSEVRALVEKKEDASLSERVAKLEGEIKALKARMGKSKQD